MNRSEQQQLTLLDFRYLYSGRSIRSLRMRIEAFDGLDNILTRLSPESPIRLAVVRQLRFESLLEIGAELGVIPTAALEASNTVSGLFAPRDARTLPSANRWLPMLYAARVVGVNRLSFPPEDPSMADLAFFRFECLDATIRNDADVEALTMELSIPTLVPDERLIEDFEDPRRFIGAMTRQRGRRRMSRDRSQRESRGHGERVTPGLRKMLFFCRELSSLVTHEELPHMFRVGVWHYYAGVFDQFGPGMGFVRMLRLVEMAADHLERWVARDHAAFRIRHMQPSEQPGESVDALRRAVELLGPERFSPPAEWRKALGPRRN